jgi:hypothetical protein
METIVFTRQIADFDVFTDNRERMIQAAVTGLRHEARQHMMQIMEAHGSAWFKIDIVMRNPVDDFAMTTTIALNLHYQPMELPMEGWDWQPAVAPLPQTMVDPLELGLRAQDNIDRLAREALMGRVEEAENALTEERARRMANNAREKFEEYLNNNEPDGTFPDEADQYEFFR